MVSYGMQRISGRPDTCLLSIAIGYCCGNARVFRHQAADRNTVPLSGDETGRNFR
jgi:hypothetical protein